MKNGLMHVGLLLACLAIVFAAGAADATRQVATAAELHQALLDLNGTSGSPIIELTGSDYDVKSIMMTPSGDSACHLYADGVVIRGPSDNPRGAVIYGDRSSRVFYLKGATLQNLTVSNGYINAGYGPAVRGYTVSGAVCTNCVITGNVGDGAENGGAGYVTLLDCEVCGNSSKHGAGATGCTIRGGSIHDNVASQSGGAGLNNNAYGVKVYNNKAAKGGAFSGNGTCLVSGCEIYDNVATDTSSSGGGGAVMHIGSSAAKLVLTNCVVRGNRGAYGGAAHYATFIDCVVSNNVATYGGAGFIANFYSSTVCSNRANQGGAVYSGTFVDCVLSNNFAESFGGAVHNAVVSNSTLVGNVAVTKAGAVSGGTVVGSRIIGNLVRPSSSSAVYGGGVYGATVIDSTIAGNAIAGSSGFGGAAYDSALVGCKVYENFAAVGSALHGGSATDCVISNNVAPGGAYTIRCTSKLTGCTVCAQQIESPGAVVNCTLTGGGKAVTIAEGANVYTSGTFAASSTYILNGQAQTVAATNCLFCGNVVSTLIAGPRSVSDRRLPFVNCTFAGNSCDLTVDGVPGTAGKNGSAEFLNCLFAGNYKWNGTTACDFSPESANSSQISIVNCLFQTPPAAGWTCERYENIITNAPRFAVKTAWPYSLKYVSPGRGAGQVSAWMATATDIRGEGFPRLRDDAVDLGCYQCWIDPLGLMLLFR